MGYGDRRFGGRRSSGQRPQRFGGSRRSGPREMHDAICSECKEHCEVPFNPIVKKDEDGNELKDDDGNPVYVKPVYCRDCFKKQRSY